MNALKRKRPVIMAHKGKWPRRLLRLWQQWEAMALSIMFFHPDDVGESEWEFDLPHWPWRPVCWIQGHESDGHIRYCIICHKDLR